MLDRERRPDARRAALAFERLDQRRLLAADIGSGADVDRDVEIEAGVAQDVSAQQMLLTPPLQHRLQRLEQVAVFAAQINQAAPRTDHPCRDRHALEHGIGLPAQQHVVLEGARLAFVGVAHHHALGAGRLAAQFPLQAGREACAAAAAQVAEFDLGQHRFAAAPTGCGQRNTGAAGGGLGQQHVGAANLVVDFEPCRRPAGHRHAGENQRGHLRHAGGVHARDDLVVVDQQRRALAAQTGARGALHSDQPVGAQPARHDAQAPAQVGHQRLAAEHAVGDVVAEQHAVGTHRLGVQEAVETGHAFDLGKAPAEPGGQLTEIVSRQPAVQRLQLAQHLHQRVRIATVARHQRLHIGQRQHRCVGHS